MHNHSMYELNLTCLVDQCCMILLSHTHTHTHTHTQIISDEVAKLQSQRAITSAKMEEYRRKLVDLGHRVIQVCLSTLYIPSCITL